MSLRLTCHSVMPRRRRLKKKLVQEEILPEIEHSRLSELVFKERKPSKSNLRLQVSPLVPRFKRSVKRPTEKETIEQEKRTVDMESPLPGLSGGGDSSASGALGVFSGRRHSPEEVIEELPQPRGMRKAKDVSPIRNIYLGGGKELLAGIDSVRKRKRVLMQSQSPRR